MSDQAFSIRKAVYCEILGKQCIEDNKLYPPGNIIITKCSYCEAFINQDKFVEQSIENDFKIGDRVRTTRRFYHYTHPDGIEGVIRSLDETYVDILTDDDKCISIRKTSVQKYTHFRDEINKPGREVKIMNTQDEMPDFLIGSEVETTEEHKEMSGLYFRGMLMSYDEHYAQIITDRDLHLSTRTKYVQEVSK